MVKIIKTCEHSSLNLASSIQGTEGYRFGSGVARLLYAGTAEVYLSSTQRGKRDVTIPALVPRDSILDCLTPSPPP